MRAGFRYRILLASADDSTLQDTAQALRQDDYAVITAHDGFEALAELRSGVPEVIVSDLELPRMSGFELLSVVRKRFPGVAVIATSREFIPVELPDGVLADRYLRKEVNSDFVLKEMIKELLHQIPLRSTQEKIELAPAWLPRSSKGYAVITCPMCLRSSSVRVQKADFGVLREDDCLHCGAGVRYRIDTTVSGDPSKNEPTVLEEMKRLVIDSRKTVVDSNTLIEESRKKTGDS